MLANTSIDDNTHFGTLPILTQDSRNQNLILFRAMQHSTDHYRSGNETSVSHTLLKVSFLFLPQSHTVLRLVSHCWLSGMRRIVLIPDSQYLPHFLVCQHLYTKKFHILALTHTHTNTHTPFFCILF